MHILDQLHYSRVNDDSLAFFAAIGVDYLALNPPPFAPMHRDDPTRRESRGAMVDYLAGVKELAAAHGIALHNVALTGVDEISLARPGRDAAIAQWCDALRALGEVGVPTMGWNFKPIGNFRTTSAIGRGGTPYSTFDYEEWDRTRGEWPDKQIDEAGMWANIQYLLERIVPVAEESGVRLALHPDDPPLPEPMGGAMRIVSSLDQYEQIFGLVPSRSNGMLFCQGCVTEMGVDVYEAIRRIGAQDRIVYVHFRNVRGSRRYFEEVFIDEGDIDMGKAMRTFKEIGFAGPFMVDHAPAIPEDQAGRASQAFTTGYIRAVVQEVYGR